MKRSQLILKHVSITFLICTLYLFNGLLLAQGAIGIANRDASPIRVNKVRPQLILPNSQRPPYEWSGAYLRNAFSNPGDNAEIFLLDSSLCGNGLMNGSGFTNHLKVSYIYRDDNRLKEAIYKHLRPNGVYENFSRKMYQYKNGQQSSYSFQVWDDQLQDWKDDYQEQIEYNDDGSWKEFVSREQNESGEWEFLLREEVAYDGNGNLKELIVSNGNGNTWEPSQRLEADFYDNGYYKTIIRQIWENGGWETITRESAELNAGESRWRSYLIERKNPSTSEFEPEVREIYEYNNYGFWKTTQRQEWDNQLQGWINVFREEYAYTRTGVWVGWLQQIWDDGDFVNHIRQRYIPGNEGRADMVQEWDEASGEWKNAFRNVITFDDDRNLEREMGTQTWDEASSSWSILPETRRCFHAWSSLQTTSINQSLPQINCGIANPYPLRTPIYCESLEIGKTYQVDMLDTNGKKVYQAKVRGGQHFSVNQPISHGIYYLRIQEGGQLKHMQKLLVRP